MIQEFHLREDLYTQIPKNGIGCELGVCRGYNAVQLFHLAKPKKLHLVDLWVNRNAVDDYIRFSAKDYQERVSNIFEEQVESGVVELHKKGSLQFLLDFDDDYFDWVYLDTTHMFDQTNAEINLCIQKVKTGGLILGDDFTTGYKWKTGAIRPVINAAQENKIKITGVTCEVFTNFMAEVL
jgi:hypothetical protein